MHVLVRMRVPVRVCVRVLARVPVSLRVCLHVQVRVLERLEGWYRTLPWFGL